MIRVAFYGKGGIGKSTTVSNLAAHWAQKGLRVLQVGCDPKADSTRQLLGGEHIPTVMDKIRSREIFSLEDVVHEGFAGVLCTEAGGPLPGLGCAGRGIITATEKLREMGIIEKYQPDVVIYDVLGDVVCGGFALPMRGGYADQVFVLTSGENMSIYAAANIGMAIDNFKNRGYATLGGLILNRRDVKGEEEKVQELANDLHTQIVGDLHRNALVTEAEEKGQILLQAFPESEMAEEYRMLADKVAEKLELQYE